MPLPSVSQDQSATLIAARPLSDQDRSPAPLSSSYSSLIAAGFPSPADDHAEGKLDLNEHLVNHPAATFFARAGGDSMIGAGIYSGDLLVVDRSIEPRAGHIVVAVINGDMTVKRLAYRDGVPVLRPENPAYCEIVLGGCEDGEIWGVVSASIRVHAP